MIIRQNVSDFSDTPEQKRKARLAVHRLRSRTWKRKNKDKLRGYQAKYREKNREKLKAYNRAHYEANRERKNANRRAWYYKNHDRMREYLNAKQRERREAHRRLAIIGR